MINLAIVDDERDIHDLIEAQAERNDAAVVRHAYSADEGLAMVDEVDQDGIEIYGWIIDGLGSRCIEVVEAIKQSGLLGYIIFNSADPIPDEIKDNVDYVTKFKNTRSIFQFLAEKTEAA